MFIFIPNTQMLIEKFFGADARKRKISFYVNNETFHFVFINIFIIRNYL